MNATTARGLVTRLLASSTSGERWTAALVMLLALALLRFGMPSPLATFAPRSAAAQPVSRTPADGAAGAPAGGAGGHASSPVAAVIGSSGPATRNSSAPNGGLAASAAVSPVVLLVHANEGTPGRDDATMAAAFASHVTFPARIETDTGGPTRCADLLALSHVFVSSDGVEPSLRDCLLTGGAVVVGFDPHTGPAATDGLVSTRVPLRTSIGDVARVDVDRLRGRVGIVTTTDLRPEVDAAVAQLKALGVDVQQVAALPTGLDALSAVAPAVLAFQGAQIDTVVFAVPVDVQTRWVALSSVVQAGTRFVVVDAYDAVIDESYPPSFDGAIAVTSVRTPWLERGHPTAAQAACTKTWEAAAVPPVTLGPDEQLRLFEWCQHLDLVAGAGTLDPSALASALRGERAESPLTSDLAPLANGGWGPHAVAELQWHATCGCWQALHPFAERPS